jgi:hypothetical protein
MHAVLPTGLFVLAVSFFLDLLDLSFGRVVWFIRTLRFWLYFILHFGISCLAAYLMHNQLTQWYLLAPAAVFLGVGVISNTNVKIGGQSLVPIADLFQGIRAKMLEQAASEKVEQAARANLASRLRKLTLSKLEEIYRNIMAAAEKIESGETVLNKVRARAKGNVDVNKAHLVGSILKANVPYVEQHIDEWDPPPAAVEAPAPPARAIG